MLAFVRDTTEPVSFARARSPALTRSSVTTVARSARCTRTSGAGSAPVHHLDARQPQGARGRRSADRHLSRARSEAPVAIINVLSRRDDPRTQKLLLGFSTMMTRRLSVAAPRRGPLHRPRAEPPERNPSPTASRLAMMARSRSTSPHAGRLRQRPAASCRSARNTYIGSYN